MSDEPAKVFIFWPNGFGLRDDSDQAVPAKPGRYIRVEDALDLAEKAFLEGHIAGQSAAFIHRQPVTSSADFKVSQTAALLRAMKGE